MRVFQGIIEIAGQMGILSGILKQKGHISIGYNIFQSYLGYQDHLINTNLDELKSSHQHIINFFDVFHFHYASSILPQFADLRIIKDKGKKMVMHHWGNDVRFHDQARVNNPYVYTGDSPPNETIHENLNSISEYIREAIVQDYEVLPYVAPYYDKVHVIPITIDIRKFEPCFPSVFKKKPLILHAPTNPAFKGTHYIESAIKKLQQKYDFEYMRIEKMNHEKAVQLYRQADIIVDQILCGSYGLLTVESMALGKPVITYLRDDLVTSFPDQLPIVNANPDTVYEKIKMLLDYPNLRYQLGVNGRIYAETHHDREIVVKQLMSIYEKLKT